MISRFDHCAKHPKGSMHRVRALHSLTPTSSQPGVEYSRALRSTRTSQSITNAVLVPRGSQTLSLSTPLIMQEASRVSNRSKPQRTIGLLDVLELLHHQLRLGLRHSTHGPLIKQIHVVSPGAWSASGGRTALVAPASLHQAMLAQQLHHLCMRKGGSKEAVAVQGWLDSSGGSAVVLPLKHDLLHAVTLCGSARGHQSVLAVSKGLQVSLPPHLLG